MKSVRASVSNNSTRTMRFIVVASMLLLSHMIVPIEAKKNKNKKQNNKKGSSYSSRDIDLDNNSNRWQKNKWNNGWQSESAGSDDQDSTTTTMPSSDKNDDTDADVAADQVIITETAPIPLPCQQCSDLPSPWMKNRGKPCNDWDQLIYRCNSEFNPWSRYWSRMNFCQKSCYDLGLAYDDDIICCPSTNDDAEENGDNGEDEDSVPVNDDIEVSSTPSCTPCSNNPSNWMERNDKTCDNYYLQHKCNRDQNGWWQRKKFCQATCFEIGMGYEGDKCCADVRDGSEQNEQDTVPVAPITSQPTTAQPSKRPSKSPTAMPSKVPTAAPSKSPSKAPTTNEPSPSPSFQPTQAPNPLPTTRNPTSAPTSRPSASPTRQHSAAPSSSPTAAPTERPTSIPPTFKPSPSPTLQHSASPSSSPTTSPTLTHSGVPSSQPTPAPSKAPSHNPTKSPTAKPSPSPSPKPTSSSPTSAPSPRPSSYHPTSSPVDTASNNNDVCTQCSDEPTDWMIGANKTCAAWPLTPDRCNTTYWKNKQFCAHTCAKEGFAYEGTNCCVNNEDPAPDSTPTSSNCVECSDTPSVWMTKNGHTCATWKGLKSKCGPNGQTPSFIQNKFCQKSCYERFDPPMAYLDDDGNEEICCET